MHATNHTDNPLPALSLVLGGTRSGKSLFAEQLISRAGSNILYIATAQDLPGAGSMHERILAHQKRRPNSWQTLEAPSHIVTHLRRAGYPRGIDGVILDCMTLLTTNILYTGDHTTNLEGFLSAISQELTELTDFIAQFNIPWVIVSSETGLGIVAPDPETRHYCDALGLANQHVATCADSVTLIVAGLPLTLK